MKDKQITHEENLKRLARIEGQVKGIQRMVKDGKYCIDIITQIQAAQSALGAVGRNILRKHIDHCVTDALKGNSNKAKEEKIDELMKILKQSCG